MKKILCLILSVAMILSCFSAGMTASALTPKDWRPDVMSQVIDPIIADKDTIFGKSIDEIGYESVNSYADNGLSLSKNSLDSFMAANADDKMLGVSYNFLYGKDNSKFLWNFLNYELEPDLTDANISIILNGADSVGNFKSWAANLGRAYTIHDVEIYAANKAGKRTTCSHKGRYDACAEIFAGYEYDYATKSFDETVYDSIVEYEEVVVNPFTGKQEIHYNYVFNFAKGNFGLVRANTNNELANAIKKVWGDGNLFSDRDTANRYAIKIANFIGNLIDPLFDEIPESRKVFTDNKKIYVEHFFEQVTVLSGLDVVLQSKWCKATHYDVRKIMAALGVNTKDDVIYDAELTKGVDMGKRILTDMYSEFCSDPVGYVIYVLQLFCQSYDYSYKAAIKDLFSVKLDSMVSKSRYEKSKYPMLDEYNGFELNTVDGLLGFIVDCIYVEKVDDRSADTERLNATRVTAVEYLNEVKQKAQKDGKITSEEEALIKKAENNIVRIDEEIEYVEFAAVNKFTFAPLPVSRISTAADINELYVYILCYLEINRILNKNSAFIDKNISRALSNGAKTDKDILVDPGLLGVYDGVDSEDELKDLKTVLESMFKGELTFSGEKGVYSFYLGTLTNNVIENFPDNFASTIKRALANFLQNWLDAMDNLMNLLFGWTDGLFGGSDK